VFFRLFVASEKRLVKTGGETEVVKKTFRLDSGVGDTNLIHYNGSLFPPAFDERRAVVFNEPGWLDCVLNRYKGVRD
jgi:hypothetical protein